MESYPTILTVLTGAIAQKFLNLYYAAFKDPH